MRLADVLPWRGRKAGQKTAGKPEDPFRRVREVETRVGKLLFRPIRAGDEAGLLEFFRERLSEHSRYLFCPHDPADPARCLGQFSTRVRRHAERRDLTLLVEREGEIIGYFFLWSLDRPKERPPSLGIGLADALHGQGVGGAMMDYLLECARALELPAVRLTHESSNERAGRLYLSRGFLYTGEEERIGSDGQRIERVMRWEA